MTYGLRLHRCIRPSRCCSPPFANKPDGIERSITMCRRPSHGVAGTLRQRTWVSALVVDVGLVEVHVGTAGGRAALALIMGAGAPGAVRVLGRRAELEEAHLPIFMPGQSLTGSVDTLLNSSVICPSKPGSMKPAVECVRMPRRPSELLPSKRAATVASSLTYSHVEPSANSPGCRIHARPERRRTARSAPPGFRPDPRMCRHDC